MNIHLNLAPKFNTRFDFTLNLKSEAECTRIYHVLEIYRVDHTVHYFSQYVNKCY